MAEVTKTTLEIQRVLAGLGLYKDKLDGIPGKNTTAAIRAFQRLNGLKADGFAGDKTIAAMFPTPIDRSAPTTEATNAAKLWPRQNDVIARFGPAGGPRTTAGTVTLPFSFRIAWNLSQRVGSFKAHELVAPFMERIFKNAAEHYGEKEFRALGLDLFGGCYNNRLMRGGSSPSMHAYGIAVDLDPVRNQLKWGRDRAEFAKPAYEPFWKIVEAEGAISLGRVKNFDWMHFQFARL